MSGEDNIINNELHGALLAADAGIREACGTILLTWFVFGVSLSITLSTGYLDEILNVDLRRFQNWAVYIAIPVIASFISAKISALMGKKAYLKYRNEILTIAKKSGFSKNQLITNIEGYKKFENISTHLKKDIMIDKEWL